MQREWTFILFTPRYLYEFLYGWLISAYNRADTFLSEHQTMTDYMKTKAVKGASSGNKKGGQGGNASGGGGKGKKKKDRSTSNARTYARDIAYCQAVQSMCGGYFKVSPFFVSSPGSMERLWWPQGLLVDSFIAVYAGNRRNSFFFFEVKDNLTTADVWSFCVRFRLCLQLDP